MRARSLLGALCLLLGCAGLPAFEERAALEEPAALG